MHPVPSETPESSPGELVPHTPALLLDWARQTFDEREYLDGVRQIAFALRDRISPSDPPSGDICPLLQRHRDAIPRRIASTTAIGQPTYRSALG